MTDASMPRDPGSGALATRLESAIECGLFGTTQLPAACRLLVHLREMEAEGEARRHRDFATMIERLADIARIARSTHAVEDVLHEPFNGLCRAFGFRRGLISSVVDNEWVPERLYIAPEIRGPHSRLRHFLGHTVIDLADAPLEAMSLRKRAAKLVKSPLQHKLTYKPLMRVSHSPGYVVAPVIFQEDVVGIVHLDQFDEEATEDDLDRLTLFTEVLGLAMQDVARRRRLATFAERVGSLARSSIRSPNHDHTYDINENHEDTQYSSLTRREQQVLDLVTLGSTNAQIARELGISETTVKSHVGGVLTKLGASTRAGAVARGGRRTGRPLTT